MVLGVAVQVDGLSELGQFLWGQGSQQGVVLEEEMESKVDGQRDRVSSTGLDCGQELFSLDHEQLHVGISGNGGGAGEVGEQGRFSKEVSRASDGHRMLGAAGVFDMDAATP